MNKKEIVIGSGFGGIAACLRLKKLGFETTLIEKLDDIGGRARVFEVNGFKHDAGPTVITAPFLFDELFDLFNKKRSDHLKFVSLEPWYRYYFHDGRVFDILQLLKKQMTKLASLKRVMLLDIQSY